jgi:hypothetical protein
VYTKDRGRVPWSKRDEVCNVGPRHGVGGIGVVGGIVVGGCENGVHSAVLVRSWVDRVIGVERRQQDRLATVATHDLVSRWDFLLPFPLMLLRTRVGQCLSDQDPHRPEQIEHLVRLIRMRTVFQTSDHVPQMWTRTRTLPDTLERWYILEQWYEPTVDQLRSSNQLAWVYKNDHDDNKRDKRRSVYERVIGRIVYRSRTSYVYDVFANAENHMDQGRYHQKEQA